MVLNLVSTLAVYVLNVLFFVSCDCVYVFKAVLIQLPLAEPIVVNFVSTLPVYVARVLFFIS